MSTKAVHKSAEPVAVVDRHDGDPWVSLNSAAEVRGKSKLVVALEALGGKARAQKVGGRWFFHRDDLVALRNSRSPNDEED